MKEQTPTAPPPCSTSLAPHLHHYGATAGVGQLALVHVGAPLPRRQARAGRHQQRLLAHMQQAGADKERGTCH